MNVDKHHMYMYMHAGWQAMRWHVVNSQLVVFL